MNSRFRRMTRAWTRVALRSKADVLRSQGGVPVLTHLRHSACVDPPPRPRLEFHSTHMCQRPRPARRAWRHMHLGQCAY
jgi:hypothetical protein